MTERMQTKAQIEGNDGREAEKKTSGLCVPSTSAVAKKKKMH